MRLFLGDGHVLNAARDDEKLTFFQMNVTIAQAQLQTPFDYEEKLVLIIVVMPNKLSFNLYQLYVGIVHFAGDFRLPVFGETSKFFGEIYFVGIHDSYWTLLYPSGLDFLADFLWQCAYLDCYARPDRLGFPHNCF